MSRALRLVAHRGLPASCPENTRAGIDAAIACGARYVEIDVQLTADHVPVVFHDVTLARVCGVQGRVFDKSFTELEHYTCQEPTRLGSDVRGEPIARLCDLDTAIPDGVTLFVEIKTESLQHFGHATVITAILDAVRSFAERCVFISFDLAVIQTLRKAHQRRVGIVHDNWLYSQHEAFLALRPDYFFCNVAYLPADGALQLPGTQLVVYEVTDPDIASALFARGVDRVETFDICTLAREVDRA